jgi:hypothetical protein
LLFIRTNQHILLFIGTNQHILLFIRTNQHILLFRFVLINNKMCWLSW